jgi:predicted transposase YbfD/YdcC
MREKVEVKNEETGKKDWKTVEFDRYYISSLEVGAQRFGYLIRQHWSIENQLHWSLDVSFGEDASKVRKDNAPENLNVLRKIALKLLRKTPTEENLSVKRKQYKSAINLGFLKEVLFGKS